MRRYVLLCSLIFSLLVFSSLALSQSTSNPKYELRGVWIATAFGIDFPKSTNPDKQKEELEKIFRDIKSKKLNTVFFQVRIRADVLFESKLEPYHDYLTGTFGKKPDYDIVQYAIDLSRKYGINFHAWFNTMILRGKNKTKKSVGVKTIWETHPDWIDARARKSPNIEAAYLNPAKPEVQAHLNKLICDFARQYDVDGIQLDDYLRYPERQMFKSDFPDDKEFKQFNPKKLNREDWRREQINQFVATLNDSLMRIKPFLRFGVTPNGVYKKVDTEPALESVVEVYQDSRAWAARKSVDYLAPQIYFHIGKTTAKERKGKKYNPAFEKLVDDWSKNKNGRHLYVGIGTYKPSGKAEWKKQVQICRDAGVEGFSFYPYNSIASIPNMFSSYALVPPMTWKLSDKPKSPENISSLREGNKMLISWTKANETRWTNLYKKSYSLAVPFEQNINTNSITIESEIGDEFYLTTIDRYGNESDFSEPIMVK